MNNHTVNKCLSLKRKKKLQKNKQQKTNQTNLTSKSLFNVGTPAKFITKMTKNLLSVTILIKEKFQINFSSNSCELVTPKGTLLNFKLKNGVYCYNATGLTEKKMLLHQRLGHPNPKMIKKIIASDGYADEPKEKRTVDCDYCVIQEKRKIGENRRSVQCDILLKRIHSGLCGAFPVVCSLGYRFYVVFLDESSRYTKVYFLKTKDEAISKFKGDKVWAEQQTNQSV